MGRNRRSPKSGQVSTPIASNSSGSGPGSINQRSAYDTPESHTVSPPTEVNTSNMSRASTKIQMDQFDSPESLRQLEVIDVLCELGLGHDISLPQVSSLLSYNITKLKSLSTDLHLAVARGCW